MTTETLTVYVAKRRNLEHDFDWLDPHTVAITVERAEKEAEAAAEANPRWAERNPFVEVIQCKLSPDSKVKEIL